MHERQTLKPPPYRLPSPGTRVGPFRVVGLLGRGGYGTVYRARWRGRDYALKFLRPESPDWKAWAEREIAIHLRLHHPNLVRFHSCGRWPDTAGGVVYLAMEYVPGIPVDRWGESPRTAREVAVLLLGICRALEAAHAAGVLHRDVKEDNILVREADGQPVLVDFGVGTYPEAPRVTRLPLPPGSWMYRTPEAVRFWQDHLGEPGSPRYRFSATDDLYPLGVITYRLLTDRTPYSPEEDRLVRELFTRVPAAPQVLNPRVPRALGEVCMRLLAKTPEERFREARELSAALEEALRGADAAWDVPLRDGGGETETRGGWARWRKAWEREWEWLGKRARVGLAVLGLGALVAAGVGLMLTEETPPEAVPVRGPAEGWAWTVPPWAVPVQEVAPPWKPPEGGGGAEPSGATTPAPVASATPGKGETRVKKKVPGPQAEKEKKGNGSHGANVLLAVVATANMACPGAQVRQEPAPRACPAGAIETMTGQLGIPLIHRGVYPYPKESNHHALFPGWEKNKPVPVKEGPFSIELEGHWTVDGRIALPWGTRLSGQLCIGEKRVYGLITQAVTPKGDTFTVCMELYDETRRGLEIEPDGGAVKVTPFPEVMAVDRFG